MKKGDLVLIKRSSECGYIDRVLNYIDIHDARATLYTVNNIDFKKDRLELLDKSKIIKFKDYDGFLTFDDDEIAYDKDGSYDKISELLDDCIEVNKCVFGLIEANCFKFNLEDEIKENVYDNCPENSYDVIDFKSPLLVEAQKLINKWSIKNDSLLCGYDIDKTVVVDLTDVIAKIKKELDE